MMHVLIQSKQTVRGIRYACTERIFDRRLTVHVCTYNKIFLKKLLNVEVCSSHLYAYFGQLFEVQVCLKINKSLLSKKEKVDDFGILPNV